MMMIMQEPDKKPPENGFLSLFHISQSQQTGEGGGTGGKYRSILTVEQSGLMFVVSRTPQHCTVCPYSARSGLTFPGVTTSLWKGAVLLLPHASAETPLL